MDYSRIEAALGRLGLLAFGGFHPSHEDGVPPMPDGRAAASLVMLGNAGAGMWPHCAGAPEFADGRPDPLDRWSRRVLTQAAGVLGAMALFPFGGPPYLPFVRWAKRAAPVAESPLGMLIHPDHGLWHAYRGALAFPDAVALPPRDARPRPCDTCAGTPCLTACPVGAFDGAGYDVPACVRHVSDAAGADCLDLGCRARRACPVGQGARYPAAQTRFHMDAFLGARLASTQRGR